MKTYTEMKAHIREILDDAGFETWTVFPGPDLPDVPGKFVVATPYGGPGLAQDGAIDQRSWQMRCVGLQNDYETAESVANAIDIAFISHYSRKVGTTWVPQIQRVGGAPNPLLVDDADRTHFVCSYIVDCAIALTN